MANIIHENKGVSEVMKQFIEDVKRIKKQEAQGNSRCFVMF